MRLPQLTTGQMMVVVAVIGVWLAIVRWDAAQLFLGAALVTYIPSFLWAANGGKLRTLAESGEVIEGRGDLFLWTWLLSSIALASVFYISLVFS